MRFRPRRDAVKAKPVIDDAHAQQAVRRVAEAQALATDDAVRARIGAAPAAYLLAHSGSDVARHAALLEPLSAPGEVRVIATPAREHGMWHLDIASRDRPGLLAMFSGVIIHESFDVARAVLATWDDGAALQALVVRAAAAPDVVALQRSLEWSLDQGLSAPPVGGVTVTFDQTASSVYTACEVTAPDRPGLLHAIAVAITNAGADIHAASVTTVAGVARDRFDLSDAAHQKLAPNVRVAIEQNLRAGFSGSVRR